MKHISLSILSTLLISPNEISQNENENNENSYLSLDGQADFSTPWKHLPIKYNGAWIKQCHGTLYNRIPDVTSAWCCHSFCKRSWSRKVTKFVRPQILSFLFMVSILVIQITIPSGLKKNKKIKSLRYISGSWCVVSYASQSLCVRSCMCVNRTGGASMSSTAPGRDHHSDS